MWHYPNLDPVAISLGPISIHWYAISYLVGIGLVWWTLGYRNRHYASGYSDEEVSDLVFFAVLGVLLGGRIGYMLFYGMENLLANPASALRVWEGGMSFHGGLIGVLLGVLWFARKTGRTFFQITDFIAPSIPIALGCGRIGNFINAELPGRVTEVPWGLVYPGEVVARHPSSLYQAMLEGPVLFVLLWVFAMKPRPVMAVSGLFLVGYGLLRIFSETFRLPDSHLGFVLFDQVTQGQLLSLPMVLLGAGFIAYSYYQPKQ
ncbi:MAG: prolipoprotein diacylglyceryl transferase [Gammaproteobacteria bacterium]